MGYKEYLSLLYERIPGFVFEAGLEIFAFGVVIILSFIGFKKGWRKIAILSLLEYVILVYCSTVIFRETSESTQYKSTSIEIYKDIIEKGCFHIHPEILMNVLVFVPIGFLVCIALRGVKWWKALMIGCGLSVSIEIMQFVLKRGTTEIGDVLHNTLGCLIGIGVYKLISITTQACRKKEIKQV